MLGAEALVKWLEEKEAPRTLAIGMLENRDLEGCLTLLSPLLDSVIAISNFTEAGAHSVEAIEEVATRLELPCEAVKDVPHLLKEVEQYSGTVLIAGSLYLVGAVLAERS